MNRNMRKNVLRKVVAMAAATLCVGSLYAQDRPTMGWSSWNTFALNISEETIKNQAGLCVSRDC